ncbi:glycosyltransferase family 2 protein [Telluria sp. B2]
MQNLLTVIIVNWNSGVQLRECVNSISQYSAGLVKQTIVVDNGSSDGSDISVEGMPNVTLVRAGFNFGFGKACNLGVGKAQGEYLLFLNPDASIYEDTLPKALTYMIDPANNHVGICGVQLLDQNGHISRSCARFPSAIGFVAHAVGLDRFFPHLGHFMSEWHHEETCEVDHVIGAFFLVRRSVFDALHGFDERFFVYLEDLDFSFRASEKGWRSVYLADVKAFHAGGGTSNQVKARRLFYSLRSRLVYAFKHFSATGFQAVLFATLVLEPLSRSMQALILRSVEVFKETWSAYGMLWRWIPDWIIKGNTR